MGALLIPASGDDWSYKLTVTGMPSGRTVTAARMSVKADPSDAQVDALVDKSITTSEDSNGEIEEDGSGGDPVLRFDFDSSDTRAIGTGVRHYDVEITDSQSNTSTVDPDGMVRAGREITVA